MLEIIEPCPAQLPLVRELFLEYADSLDFDLGFQGFEQELASLPGEYASPAGCVLLARLDTRLAGCIALRPLAEGIAEMKRLYVRPSCQGKGVGRALSVALLRRAALLGYDKLRLDTVPSMHAALGLYRSMGFYSIPPYRENPIPGASYLEICLSALAAQPAAE